MFGISSGVVIFILCMLAFAGLFVLIAQLDILSIGTKLKKMMKNSDRLPKCGQV